MQESQNTSNWFDRLWAAFIFFTRLPFWRIYQPQKEAFKAVVEFWPFTGWLTAGVMAGVLYGLSLLLPFEITILLAFVIRLLVTGALHEDGLADFFDGFGGGGSDRQRILTIMKDSHIGTYGVLSLIIYFMLLWVTMRSFDSFDAAITILVADPFSKMLSSIVTQVLPYARNEESAKNKTIYRKFSTTAIISLALQGLIPLGLYLWWMQGRINTLIFVLLPLIVVLVLILFIKRRINGYTGDCCGAVFLLIELSVYIVSSYYLHL